MLYGFAQISTQSSNAIWEIRASATNSPLVLEVGVVQSTTTTGNFGFARSLAVGVSPTVGIQTINGVAEENTSAPTSQTQTSYSWGTAPTIPTNYNRRVAANLAAIGLGVIWTFPRGFKIAAGQSAIVALTVSGGTANNVWCLVDE